MQWKELGLAIILGPTWKRNKRSKVSLWPDLALKPVRTKLGFLTRITGLNRSTLNKRNRWTFDQIFRKKKKLKFIFLFIFLFAYIMALKLNYRYYAKYYFLWIFICINNEKIWLPKGTRFFFINFSYLFRVMSSRSQGNFLQKRRFTEWNVNNP